MFWEAAQGALEKADSDVLIFMDTCGSHGDPPSSTIKSHERQGTTEMIASFEIEGFDLRAPTMSFTFSLVSQLTKFIDIFEVFSAADLHRAMANQYIRSKQVQRYQSSVVPIFVRLNGKPQACSILLQPVEMQPLPSM